MTELGSFSDLASIKGNTVERPKNLPDGFYITTISGPCKEHKSAKKGTLAMRFPVRLQGAQDEEVQAHIAADPKLQKALEREYFVDFWMTADSLWRFTSFCKAQGISDDLNIVEMAEALVASGNPFLLKGTNEADANDPEKVFFRIGDPVPMPA